MINPELIIVVFHEVWADGGEQGEGRVHRKPPSVMF